MQLCDWIAGAHNARDDSERRRVRILFLLLTTITPLLVFTGNTDRPVFEFESPLVWYGGLIVLSLLLLVISRTFRAERMVGVIFGFWVLSIIATGPVFYGEPERLSLITLVLIPLIMGSVSGAAASLLGTLSVVLVYSAVLVSAHLQQKEITDAGIALVC
ncbi:MAG: hypothetical protein AAFV37_12355, partial [Pseudomonadota bacterium]